MAVPLDSVDMHVRHEGEHAIVRDEFQAIRHGCDELLVDPARDVARLEGPVDGNDAIESI
jgi:hypothetical protein